MSQSLAWTQIIVTALLTALLSFGVSVAFFHYSNRAPELVYERFPTASFSKDAIEVGISSARLENSGDKEAEEVQVYFQLANDTSVQDVKVEPTSPAIKFDVATDLKSGIVEVLFPRLNPNEGARFSLLLDKSGEGIDGISVRGKGITGRSGPKDKDRFDAVFLLFGVAAAVFGVLISMLSRSLLESRLGEIFRSQKRLVEEELRVVRTKGSDKIDLREKLLGTKYRLFYNPRSQRSKVITFVPDGEIGEGRNNNENRWRVKGNVLELVDSDGNTHSRFYFSATDNMFYHTNDPDTGSIIKHNIRDQYIIPES